MNNLYQLWYDGPCINGQEVSINSPYDTYGKVIKLIRTKNGRYLCLVRGTGKTTTRGHL